MTNKQLIRWYEKFVEEWVFRFGFMAQTNEPDSLEAIDEVACLMGEQRDSATRHCDDLEAALKRARAHVVKAGDEDLLQTIDRLVKP